MGRGGGQVTEKGLMVCLRAADEVHGEIEEDIGAETLVFLELAVVQVGVVGVVVAEVVGRLLEAASAADDGHRQNRGHGDGRDNCPPGATYQKFQYGSRTI